MLFRISFAQRLVLFLCATVLCFVIGSVAIGLIVAIKGQTPAIMRISAVLQDIIVFITPALLTAIISTRLPARFLAVEKKPAASVWIWACLVLLFSVPAMNALVMWNESIQLPSAMREIEEAMRQAEDSAQASVGMLLGNGSIGALIVSILIVGVLAGLSEELFFRGAFQRLLSTGGVNTHVAIWLVAFLFSAMHLQFYGFFGRLVLGAYFGYLLYWSRCLWVPIIVHIFNNTVYILGNHFSSGTLKGTDINNVGSENTLLVIISVLFTVLGIVCLRRICIKKTADDYKSC